MFQYISLFRDFKENEFKGCVNLYQMELEDLIVNEIQKYFIFGTHRIYRVFLRGSYENIS